MAQWLLRIDEFRAVIWENVIRGRTLETSNSEDNMVTLDILFESFRIFGFLDDTGFRTTVPDIGARRRLLFFYDIQRALYSGYISVHGI